MNLRSLLTLARRQRRTRKDWLSTVLFWGCYAVIAVYRVRRRRTRGAHHGR